MKQASAQLNSFYSLGRTEQKKCIESQKKQLLEFHYKNNMFYWQLKTQALPNRSV